MALSTWIGPALWQVLHSSYFVPGTKARKNLRNTPSALEKPMVGPARPNTSQSACRKSAIVAFG
jgi:hypothetical protein